MKRCGMAGVAVLVAMASFGADATVELRMASNAHRTDPPTVGDQVAFEWLQQAVEEQTNSEVSIEVYWGQALGDEAQLLSGLETGVVDILPNAGSNVARVIPQAGLLSTSYLFRDFDHYKAVVNDDAFFGRLQEIVDELDLGYQLVGMGATGSRNLYNRAREIETPEDAQGLKMRVMASPVEFKVWSTMGMIPSNVPSSEIYMALQTGVVDAAESSIPFIVSNKYYEVAPHISLTNHQISTHLYFMNDEALARVPEEHRDTLLALLRETGNRHIDATKELSAEMLETLRAQPGVTVTEVDTAEFADKLVALQDEVAKELGVTDLLEVIRSH